VTGSRPFAATTKGMIVPETKSGTAMRMIVSVLSYFFSKGVLTAPPT